jgi:undecaprenyl-diphosphatase
MELTIFQYFILGVIQGITEWLPVSSSGIGALVMTNFFNVNNIGEIIHFELFLHLGTFFAALIYFRKDVFHLIRSLFNCKYQTPENKKILSFLIITTLISGGIGFFLLAVLKEVDYRFTGEMITFIVGVFLFFTGVIQIKIKNKGLRKEREIKSRDSVFLGVLQGAAAIPGLSRSGVTVGGLLLSKFDDTSALRLSFLMSLPIVLAGNIILNLNDFGFLNGDAVYGLLGAFAFGLLTIYGLMEFSRKINFGWFVLIFSLLMIGSVFL